MLSVCRRAVCRCRGTGAAPPTAAARSRRAFSSSAAGEEDESEVGVFWDFENCPVPSGLDPFLVRLNIERALRKSGYLGPISITGYGNIHLISRAHVLEALSETGVDLHHVPNGGKNSSDRALLIDMLLWTIKHSPPAHVLLISGDSDFSVLLHKMRLLSYNVLLAAPNKTGIASALANAASRVWVWPDMATGEGPLGQTCTNESPVFHGKDFSSYDVSRNRDAGPIKQTIDCLLSEENGGHGEGLKDGGEDAVRDGISKMSEARWIPSALVNRIVDIVEERPGISLGDISKELKSLNINPRSFGCSNFYHLLLSMQRLQTRFVDGLSMRDRVRFHLAGKDHINSTNLRGDAADSRESAVHDEAAGKQNPKVKNPTHRFSHEKPRLEGSASRVCDDECSVKREEDSGRQQAEKVSWGSRLLNLFRRP